MKNKDYKLKHQNKKNTIHNKKIKSEKKQKKQINKQK